MAVAYQNVEPAIVVHIEEPAAPSQVSGVQPETGAIGRILKGAFAIVEIQRVGVAREVGLHDAECSGVQVVSGGNSHAGLRLSIGAEGSTGGDRHVLEL